MWRNPFGSPRMNQPLQVGVFFGCRANQAWEADFFSQALSSLVGPCDGLWMGQQAAASSFYR